jgi:hypothetical protein
VQKFRATKYLEVGKIVSQICRKRNKKESRKNDRYSSQEREEAK